jgi:hypothetical protein
MATMTGVDTKSGSISLVIMTGASHKSISHQKLYVSYP